MVQSFMAVYSSGNQPVLKTFTVPFFIHQHIAERRDSAPFKAPYVTHDCLHTMAAHELKYRYSETETSILEINIFIHGFWIAHLFVP